MYGGASGKSKSTNPKDIEEEVRAAFNETLKEVRKQSGLPSTTIIATTAGATENGSVWNPTQAIGTGPIKASSSPSVVAEQTDSSFSGGRSSGGGSRRIQVGETASPTIEAEPRSPNILDLTINSAKQGYYNSRLGQEAWKAIQGKDNELDKYKELLNSDDYNYEADDWWEKSIAGFSEQFGQWTRKITDPETLALAGSFAGATLLAGQAGPQALIPEEVITVPTAASFGVKMGSAKASMEIEAGLAYLEMLEHGISEKTARTIAMGVGAANAMLDVVQLDELLSAYKILDEAGVDDSILSILYREVTNRGLDALTETGLEDVQELTTITGTQIGSKLDTGEWAYTGREVADRLWDTTKDSLLSFGLTNAVPVGHNVYTQTRNQLAAQGEIKLCSGEMPTSRELEAMGLSESEALGTMVLLQMEEPDDAENRYQTNNTDTDAVSKADILSQNRLQGRLYEQQEFSAFKKQHFNAVEQITIRTKSGIRTRVDAIAIDADGNVVIHEFKSSATAPLTKNQKTAFREIAESGGVVIGAGKGIFTRGYQIPAGTQTKIVRPQ